MSCIKLDPNPWLDAKAGSSKYSKCGIAAIHARAHVPLLGPKIPLGTLHETLSQIFHLNLTISSSC